MSNDTSKMRWDPYVLAVGTEFDKFWEIHLKNCRRDILFIVGRGFDARAELGSKQICNINSEGRRAAWLLNFISGMSESKSHIDMASDNFERYKFIFGQENIKDLSIRLPSSDDRGSTSRYTSNVIGLHKNQFEDYNDVVIDISAMPRMIAMTVIVKVLYILDDIFKKKRKDINLHILTAENVHFDRNVTQDSPNDIVTSVIGFSGELDSEATEPFPRVWFPILGEGQKERLAWIHEELQPDEICPVIPFPSRDARRGDKIITEYREILFDNFRIDPNNILHACEFNPFEAYKQIYNAIDRYRNSLSEFDECKVFISPLSSKLLSVGAVLACYNHREEKNKQLKVGISHVETINYGSPMQITNEGTKMYSMWIRGEWER